MYGETAFLRVSVEKLFFGVKKLTTHPLIGILIELFDWTMTVVYAVILMKSQNGF